MPKKVLIAGASRGIGLELAVQYAAEGWDVIATCREPDAARGWLPANVDVQTLDVSSATSVAGLAWHVDDTPIDLLIVCAGVYGPSTGSFLAPGDEDFDLVMRTNVLGPMRLIQALASSVAQAQGVMVVISSKMGAMSSCSKSNGLLYRASKAAANMVVKVAANEFGAQGATVISLHPGWVQTDMGGAEADLNVTDAVEQIRKTLANIGANHNGKFFDLTGRELAW